MPDRPFPASAGEEDAASAPRAAAPSSTFHVSQEPVTTVAAAASVSVTPTPAPAYEHLGELPASYGGPSVYLVAYDPRRLFAYWDLDPTAAGSGRGAGPLALRVRRADTGETESQVAVDAGTGASHPGQYLPVQRSGISYYVELGRGGEHGMPWRALAVSARVVVPPEGLAAGTDAQFATLPFHLSFQRLTDLLQTALETGRQEGLTQALARLQQPPPARDDQPGTTDPAVLQALDRLNGEQRRNLQNLLGSEIHLSSRAGPSSGAGASSGQPFRATGAGGSESLSSFRGGGGPSSGAFSSRGFAVPGSGAFRPGAAAGSEQRLGQGPSAGFSSGSFLARSGPSSEAWRRAAASGASGSSSPGGSPTTAARERAERFLRAVTSSLDVLGALFGSAGAGGSERGGSSSSSPTSSRGRW